MEKMYKVGKIVNTHGLMGEVRVISTTDFAAERYVPGNILYYVPKTGGSAQPLTIKSHRQHKTFDLLTFEGYMGINQVEHLKEGVLKVTESQLQPLEENAYYFHEIIGCTVVTTEGETLGEIKEILTPGANDVWVVETAAKKEILIPYIADVVKTIDIPTKTITIEVMEGLL